MEQNAVRKLVSYATALTLLGSPLTVNALGLGRLVVSSPIDTPLAAEIELTALGAADLGTIEVELASRQEFDNATIDRSQILQLLRFQVDRRADNTPIIRVTSSEAIAEPFLQFLITVQWPGGKLIREYTALLDPPLYAGAQSQNDVNAPVADGAVEPIGEVETTEVQITEQNVQTPVETQVVDSTSPTEEVVTGGIDNAVYSGAVVTTRSGDTLTEIASTLSIPDGVNMYQAMLAIQQANPSAFIDGNMNRLKRGVELTIPDLSGGIATQAQARQAFTEQAAAFERFRQGAASSAPTRVATNTPAAADETPAQGADQQPVTETPAETASTPAPTVAQPEAEATTSSQDTAAGKSSDTVTTDGQLKISKANVPAEGNERQKLVSQLSQAEEQVSSLDAENQELRERLALLESKVEQSTRLAQIEQSRMAELEAQAKATAKAREQANKEAEAEAERLRVEQAAKLQQQQAEEQRLAAELAQQQLDSQTAGTPADTNTPGNDAGNAGTAISEGVDQAADKVSDVAATAAQGTADAGEQVAQKGQSFLETAKTKIDKVLGRDGVETATTGSQNAEGVAGQSRGFFASFAENAKGFLAGSWAMMGAFGLIVMGLIGLIIWRRRRSIAEFEESILSGSALDIQTDTAETGTASTAATDTSFLSEFGVPGMGGMQTDEVDPIAEAEVYMAYGRDEQAEEVLKEAINRDSRPELKLKLLEIYRSRNEVKEFETLAEELYPAHGNEPDEVWRKVVEMGQQISPANPLFKGGVVAASAAAVGAAMASGGGGGAASAYSPAQQPDSVANAMNAPDMDSNAAVDAFPQPSSDASVDQELEQLTQQAELANPSLETFQLNDIERSQQVDQASENLAADSGIDTGIDYEFGAAATQETDDLFGIENSDEVAAGNAQQVNASASDQDSMSFDMKLDDGIGEDKSSVAGLGSGLGVGAGVAAAGAAAAGIGSSLSDSASSVSGKLGDTLSDTKENVRGLFSQQADELPDDLSLASLTDTENDMSTVELEHESLSSLGASHAGSVGMDSDGLGLDIDGVTFDTTDEAEMRLSDAIDSDANDSGSTPSPVPGSDGDSDNATKLDLAKAYRDMGDDVGARGFLEEVIKNGSDQQRHEATELMSQIESA